jgi:O-acetyl-ADP-ribose deacetylase (regulator of RNase III)
VETLVGEILGVAMVPDESPLSPVPQALHASTPAVVSAMICSSSVIVQTGDADWSRGGVVELEAVLGDITREDVDAIVNAANSSLLGGGGVDGAIHRAAGPQLVEACRALGGCPEGGAKVTPGFDLPATWIIHAVGPRWRGGAAGEAETLAACYRNSLARADEVGATTVSFPAISTGIFGYPLEAATDIAIETVRSTPTSVTAVRFVCFDRATLRAYVDRLEPTAAARRR